MFIFPLLTLYVLFVLNYLLVHGSYSAVDNSSFLCWLTLFWLLVIASDVINVTLVIAGEECTDGEYNQLWEKLSKMVTTGNSFL